jgi:hypothetical protein
MTVEEIEAEVERRVKLHRLASKKYGFGRTLEKYLKKFKTVEEINRKLKEVEDNIKLFYEMALESEREVTDAYDKMKASAMWRTVGYHILLRKMLLQKRKELLAKIQPLI